MTSYTKLNVALPTAAVLASSLFISGVDLSNFQFERPAQIGKTPELAIFRNTQTQYEVVSEDALLSQNIEAIHQFASNILENVEDLDPEFSELIDENYWDLI